MIHDGITDQCTAVPTRRQLLRGLVATTMATGMLSMEGTQAQTADRTVRAVNIMNFIRAEEPREPMDLILPVREQMKHIKAHGLAATWLLQYDALVEGPFVEFLKSEMPPSHEVGIWFEMNRKICDAAGIPWRGNPNWEWDYHVPVAYAIGYTPTERRKLVDTAMRTFRRVFGKDARSIGSWNLDAVSVAHLSDHYDIDAFANCRDQLATDGFTIWGAPICGYYPNRVNAWSPAVNHKNQLKSPIFRLLGQDPVYYYDNQLSYPDTMEPVWPSGQSPIFVDNFLHMMEKAPASSFTYAQLGQENSFGWAAMRNGYAMQMTKLAAMAQRGAVSVETMGETGRKFKRLFQATPTQAQVMLTDPYGHTTTPERTIWYQSRFLRANLHFRGNEFYLRDMHVYHDEYEQPYLTNPATIHGIEQRMLAMLDGYHWSDENVRQGRPGVRAMGKFAVLQKDGTVTPLTMTGGPDTTEHGSSMTATVAVGGGDLFEVRFTERDLIFKLTKNPQQGRLLIIFDWVPGNSSLVGVQPNRLLYRYRGFGYQMHISGGTAAVTAHGVQITSATAKSLTLTLAQVT